MTTFLRSRPAGALLTAAIVALTLATGYIHFTLGGLLFTLNALGYAGAAVLIVVGAAATHPFVRSFSWLPRVGLIGYAVTTIGAYLVMGPYFGLGWIAKAIETTILALLAVDVVRAYGSPVGLVRAALASVGLDWRPRSRQAA